MASSGENCSFCHSVTYQPRNGWRLRDSIYAKLCVPCFTAYEDGTLCDKYHADEDGWRQCDVCGMEVHCGCIMGQNTYETNDTCGVTCKECLMESSVVSSVGDTSFLDEDSFSELENFPGVEVLADPAIGNISADPTTENASADLATGNASADPATGNASADPATGNASADPATGNASADPATGDASADPVIGDASAEPIIGDACADPSIGNASADSTIGNSADYQFSTWHWF